MGHIVIIEDDVPMRSLIAEWLTAAGYCVHTDAKTTGAPVAVELAIVNVSMPRDLGVERLRDVRSTYPGVPIIAISGHFRPGLRCAGPAAQALHVDRVIPKPFERETLLHTVRSVIGRPIEAVT